MHECAWNVAVTNGITKQELRQYRSLRCEIEELQAERQRLLTKTGSAPDGQPRSTEPGDVVGDTAIQIAKLAEKISARIAELTALRWRIEMAIELIPNSRDRRLIHLRYIEGKRWEEIALDLNHEYSWVLRLHGRILQQLAKQATKSDTIL